MLCACLDVLINLDLRRSYVVFCQVSLVIFAKLRNYGEIPPPFLSTQPRREFYLLLLFFFVPLFSFSFLKYYDSEQETTTQNFLEFTIYHIGGVCALTRN